MIRVEREDELYYENSMPVEILVRYEPPADTSRIAPPSEPGVPTAPQPSDSGTPVAGGASFNTAVLIEPGTTYSGTIATLEAQYFKVPMTWGQQLSHAFRPDDVEVTRDVFISASLLKVEVYDPMRREVDYAYKQGTGPGGDDLTGGTSSDLRATDPTFNLDGFVYLRVNLGGTEPAGTFIQDFRFVVETVGEPEEGPIYLVDGATASPTASPSASPEESASPSPSASTDASADPVDATESRASAGIPGWVWILGAGVLIAAAALLILRRLLRPRSD